MCGHGVVGECLFRLSLWNNDVSLGFMRIALLCETECEVLERKEQERD